MNIPEIITNEWITENWKNLNWHIISKTLSEDLIDLYLFYVDWDQISSRTDLSDDFLVKFKNKIDWTNFLQNNTNKLTTEFIQKFNLKDLVNCFLDYLSEDFIREWKDEIVWDTFLFKPQLFLNKVSIDFIR